MALTEKQVIARGVVLEYAASGFPLLVAHNGNQPAIHGNHLGWLREALADTSYSWADGQAPIDVLRNAFTDTWWGQSLYTLYVTDQPTAIGWKVWLGGGKRPQWWTAKEERGTALLGGYAKKPSYVMASVESVPWLSSAWPRVDGGAPVNQGTWLQKLRDEVLFRDQYDDLRAALGLLPDVGGPEEPEEPEEPGLPSKLKARLEEVFVAIEELRSDIEDRLSTIEDDFGTILDSWPEAK